MSEEIIDDKFYSLVEAQKLCAITSREFLVAYINAGVLYAVVEGGKGNGKRYSIKGEWIKEFNEKYAKMRSGIYFTERMHMRAIARPVIRYCKKNKLETIADLVEHLKK